MDIFFTIITTIGTFIGWLLLMKNSENISKSDYWWLGWFLSLVFAIYWVTGCFKIYELFVG